MSKDFEQDELLVALKKSAKEQEAPMLDDRIITSATVSDSVKGPRRWFTPRTAFSVIGGAAAFAVIAGVTFSMNSHGSDPISALSNTNPSADSGTNSNELNPGMTPQNGTLQQRHFKLPNPGQGSGGNADSGVNQLRIWVPDVVATAGPNLSEKSHWTPIMYDSFQAIPNETLLQRLADYFGVEGEATRMDKSNVWVEDGPSQQFDILEIRDKKTGYVFVVDRPTPSFYLEMNSPNQGSSGEFNTKAEAKARLQQIIKAIQGEIFREDWEVKYSDVTVSQDTDSLHACANQIVGGHEVPIQLCASFVNGSLSTVSGTLAVFGENYTVQTESEKDAVSRLGSYFDNPYRVTVLGDPGSTLYGGPKLDSYLEYCENNPSVGTDCITTVDKAVRGYGVTYDKNGVLWVVPSYSMYHNGFFIGSVNALSSEYLNQ